MTRFIPVFAWLAAGVLAGPCPCALGQAAPQPADERMPKLAEWLTGRGYVEVPLASTRLGLMDVKVEANRAPMVLVLDTGANNINLDTASAARAKLAVTEVAEKTAVAGGTVATAQTRIDKFSVGGLSAPWGACAIDFKATNALRSERGDPPCDGVLGGSYLFENSAVIDTARQKLYLLDPAKDVPNPSEFLRAAGYVEVPLTLNALRFLDVDVRVGGTPMRFFLDTGLCKPAGLDWSSARGAKLNVAEDLAASSELGGRVKTGSVKAQRLTIGPFDGRSDFHVTDLSSTRSSRKKHNVPLCDGNLGGPFFKAHSAVIDYGNQKLFLLTPPGK